MVVVKTVVAMCNLHVLVTTRRTTTLAVVARQAVAAQTELKTVAVRMMKAVAVVTEMWAWSWRRLLANLSLPDRQHSKR